MEGTGTWFWGLTYDQDESDGGRDRTDTLQFLERCIPGNCVGEVHTYLNIAFRIMMVKSFFELDIITFNRALAISFGITSVWSLYDSIVLVAPFVVQTVKIRNDLWKCCRTQEDLMDKFKETRKQGRKTRKEWRATLRDVNRQNKKAKAMGKTLVVPPEEGRRARDRYMIFRDDGSLDEGMLQACLAKETRPCEEKGVVAAGEVERAKESRQGKKSRGRRQA